MEWAYFWGPLIIIFGLTVLIVWGAHVSRTDQLKHLATLKAPEDHEREALKYLKWAESAEPIDAEPYLKKYQVHKALAEELRTAEKKRIQDFRMGK